jgi:glycosyltransferase involved in cell wall biosynthesis
MIIILDSIVFSLQKAGGISTYWCNMCVRILKSPNLIYLIEEEYSGNIEHEKLLKIKRPIYKSRFTLKPFVRFLNLNTQEISSKFIFHSSYYRVTKNKFAVNVVTIHDFIYEKFYSGFRKWLHVYQKSYSINNADVIITVSNNTKKDLLKYYPKINPNNVKVVYNGVSEEYFPINKDDSRMSNSILFVGSREKYKNFDLLVKILSEIRDYDLIIVGDSLKKNEIFILNKMLKNRWKNFTYLSNFELNKLYNSVFALAYVSSYEGFGIPLIESMRAGCPFIALRNSSIIEVAGNAGVLINSLTATSFISGLMEIKEFREDIIQKGLIRSLFFSWDKCYTETLKIYEEYLNE